MLNTNKLSKQDKEALLQYTKHFIRKSVQIIVQSRLGEKKPTKSRVHAYNSDWFNLSIKDLIQITSMTKASLGTESIFNLGSPYCIEISLKTPENQTMILETWCILFNEQLCDLTQKICYSVYKKMSLVLRSLLCMTRSMPTYQLSRRQSSDTYVLLYRMYCGEPIVYNLGEKYATAKVGTIGTPIGTLVLNVAYRTRLTMTPHNTNSDAIFIKDDHFYVNKDDLHEINSIYSNTNQKVTQRSTSLKVVFDAQSKIHNTNSPSQTLNEIINDKEQKQNQKRSQPIAMGNKTNQIFESPRQQRTSICSTGGGGGGGGGGNESSEEYSRNSSIASTPSDTMYYFKLKSAVFAPPSTSLTSNNAIAGTIGTSTMNEVPPFISLLCNEFANLSPNRQQQQQNQQHDIIQAQSPPPPSTIDNELEHHKSPPNEIIPQTDDYVYIESKRIAFGLSDAANDLSNFFRSCENAPILETFNTEPNLSDTIKDLDQQLLSYESKVAEFDDLVKSLETV